MNLLSCIYGVHWIRSMDVGRWPPGTAPLRPRPSLPSVSVRDPNVGSVPGTDGELPSRPNPGWCRTDGTVDHTGWFIYLEDRKPVYIQTPIYVCACSIWHETHHPDPDAYPDSYPDEYPVAYPDAYPDTATIFIQDIKWCWDSWSKYTCNTSPSCCVP